jgi:hypothetical protein
MVHVRNVKEQLLEELYGKTAMREMKHQKELAHARELAAIRKGEGEGAPEQPTPSTGSASEIERRALLLAEYKAATKTISNRQIYEARNSRIHKPEFYTWRNGTLPAHSATSINFERFLREKRPPQSR